MICEMEQEVNLELDCWKIFQQLSTLSISVVLCLTGLTPKLRMLLETPHTDISMNRCSLNSSGFLNTVSFKTSLVSVFGIIIRYECDKVIFFDKNVDTKTVQEAI